MASIRDQISSLTVAQLEANQLSAVAGKVFMSANSVHDQQVAHDLTTTWRAVHVPTYGQSIPASSFVVNHTGDGAAYVPSVNESALINGLSITNGDPLSAATVTFDIDGVAVYQSGSIAPFALETVIGLQNAPFQITYGQTLTVTVTGATAALVAVDLVGFLVVQG